MLYIFCTFIFATTSQSFATNIYRLQALPCVFVFIVFLLFYSFVFALFFCAFFVMLFFPAGGCLGPCKLHPPHPPARPRAASRGADKKINKIIIIKCRNKTHAASPRRGGWGGGGGGLLKNIYIIFLFFWFC